MQRGWLCGHWAAYLGRIWCSWQLQCNSLRHCLRFSRLQTQTVAFSILRTWGKLPTLVMKSAYVSTTIKNKIIRTFLAKTLYWHFWKGLWIRILVMPKLLLPCGQLFPVAACQVLCTFIANFMETVQRFLSAKLGRDLWHVKWIGEGQWQKLLLLWQALIWVHMTFHCNQKLLLTR